MTDVGSDFISRHVSHSVDCEIVVLQLVQDINTKLVFKLLQGSKAIKSEIRAGIKLMSEDSNRLNMVWRTI